MKKHSDKGRFLVAQAMLKSDTISPEGKSIALDCVLNYVERIEITK